jgi:tetratricopeptide (TPR) repeat protein
MRYNCLLFLFLSFYVNAQSSKTDCHSVNNFLDQVSSKHYWGSPEWQTLMDSALAICPTSGKGWGNKGMIYLMRGDVATWYQCAEKAVQYDPLYFLGNRAWHRLRYLRDYEGAFNDLLKQDSITNHFSVYVSDVHHYILMGQCKEGLSDYTAAMDYYNRSLAEQIKERGENWVGTYDYLIRGELKLKMNDLEGALSDLNKQIQSYEQLADTYYYRGLIYKKMNQLDLAKTDLEKANSLLKGQGFRRWDPLVIITNEVYLSDIQEALSSLR